MAAVGSRDGREIVRELDALRTEGVLDRDDRGRYLLTS
jgi:2,5-furandicarboxylate decarboxylase 1